ncbi:carnitine dehydratase [Fragilaria crotonensis]|nr:carnitine dehydratase [Fragilaria crotonensis]
MASSSSIKAVVGRALREAGVALKQNVGVEFFTRHRPIMTFYGSEPFITNDTFIAPSASVIGEGTLETGFPPITHIGHYVSVGAGSVLTSCRIDDVVIIGEKCTIMEGSLVESYVILEPGTVVPAYARIPSGQKWGGNPAKCIADITGDERDSIQAKARKIYEQAYEHMVEFLPVGNSYLHLEDLEKKGVAKQG